MKLITSTEGGNGDHAHHINIPDTIPAVLVSTDKLSKKAAIMSAQALAWIGISLCWIGFLTFLFSLLYWFLYQMDTPWYIKCMIGGVIAAFFGLGLFGFGYEKEKDFNANNPEILKEKCRDILDDARNEINDLETGYVK